MKLSKSHYIMAVVTLMIGLTIGACSSSSSADASPGHCGDMSGNVSDQQQAMQDCTKHNLANTHVGDWFPQLHGPTAEMGNVAARMIRMNDPNRIGYVGVWSANGALVSMDTIRGKVSSTGSQLTNLDNTVGHSDDSHLGERVVRSPGDDGTYGPEECEGVGIFYFLASNDSIQEVCVGAGIWKYSDAPFDATTKPSVVVTANTTTAIPAGGSTKK